MHDAQELDQHLKETEWFIEQYRARMNPMDYDFSEEESEFGGFGPKSPCSDEMIDFADDEALLIGSLARYCMLMGSIPVRPLRAFWWVGGRCRGLKSCGDLTEFRKTVQHLRHHCEEVFNTEGAGEFFDAMDDARKIGKGLFPNEDTDWLTMEEAKEFTGKDESTIYKWLKAGGVPTLDDRWGLMISKVHLQTKMAIVYASKLSAMKKAREMNKKNA